MSGKFLVLPEHGRVFRPAGDRLSVLVAKPGDEIDVELARECGLIPDDEPVEAPPPAPEPKPAKAAAKKATKASKAAKTASYPTPRG